MSKETQRLETRMIRQLGGILLVLIVLGLVLAGPLFFRKQVRLHVSNGLPEQVTVAVAGRRERIPAGKTVELSLPPRAEYELVWSGEEGTEERLRLNRNAEETEWLWNVDRARTYQLQQLVYEVESQERRVRTRLIAPVLLNLTDVDYRFESLPPAEEKLRVSRDRIRDGAITLKALIRAPDAQPDLARWTALDGRRAEALAILDRTVEQFPGRAALLSRCGDAYFELEEAERAREAWQNAIAKDPWEVNAHRGLQDLGRAEGRIEALRKKYEELRVAHPTEPASHYFYGRLLPTPDLSSQRYRKALELDPSFLWAHYGLGFDHRMKGRYTEAIAAYSEVLSIDPGFDAARVGLIWSVIGAMEDAEDLRRAMAVARAASERLPIRPRLLEATLLTTMLGGSREGLPFLTELIAQNPRALPLLDLYERVHAISRGTTGPHIQELTKRAPRAAAKARFLAAIASKAEPDILRKRFEAVDTLRARIHAALALCRAGDPEGGRELVESLETRFDLPRWAYLAVGVVTGREARLTPRAVRAQVGPGRRADVLAALISCVPEGMEPSMALRIEKGAFPRAIRSVDYSLAVWISRHPMPKEE